MKIGKNMLLFLSYAVTFKSEVDKSCFMEWVCMYVYVPDTP